MPPIVFKEALIHGEWTQDLNIHLNGLDMDDVWEDLIKQVGNIVVEEENDLDSQIAIDEECRKRDLEIKRLEKKIVSERQSREKRETYDLIKKMKALNSD